MADLEIPNFPALLMEPLLAVPERSRVGFIARLERSAADRYRVWAAEDASLAKGIDLSRYLDEDVGEATLGDILRELEKPGRDPRQRFEPPKFRDDVREFDDLRDGMLLEGVVTNVTHFGAFVDVGVHQDGLVHISELADQYVGDPHAVVKVGDRLSVRVLKVDRDRRRIGLSAKRE